MTKKGYVGIHRTLTEHYLWQDKPFSKGQAWIDLLLMVNHSDAKILIGSRLVEVMAGSKITSEIKLSERWGWSRKKTRGFLKVLERDGMLVKKSTTKDTTISIVNWELYRLLEQQKVKFALLTAQREKYSSK